MLLVGISTVQQVRQGVEMAVIAALKKKRVASRMTRTARMTRKVFTPQQGLGGGWLPWSCTQNMPRYGTDLSKLREEVTQTIRLEK